MLKTLASLAALVSVPAAAAPTYSIVDQYSSGADGSWDLLSVDPVNHRLFIARSDAVMAVDLSTGEVIDKLLQANRAHASLVIPGTSEVIATNGNTDTAVIFDGASGQVRATIATGKRPDAVAWDPATRTLWVMNPGDGTISVVDPVAARVIATVPVGGSLEFGAADGRGRLYVTLEDKNQVAAIDTLKRAVIARQTLPGCDGPTGIVYLPDQRETVSACANGVADVLTSDGRPVTSVPIGRHPDGAAYDSRRRTILIPSGSEGVLYVLSASGTPRLIQRLATVRSARTIALDPTTGRAYLPSAEMLPAVTGQRPQMKPGTFRILVVAPSR